MADTFDCIENQTTNILKQYILIDNEPWPGILAVPFLVFVVKNK
jgi:hypothetical protein